MNFQIKPRSSILLVASCAILLCSGMSSVGNQIPQSVRIGKKDVFIDQNLISKDWKFKTVERSIGAPEYTEGNGKPDAMYDYMQLGMRLFQRRAPEMGKYLEEVKFYIASSADIDETPFHSAFPAVVLLDSTALDSTFTPARLQRSIPDWRVCNAYTAHTYEYMSDKNYIFVGYNDAETKLVWICVGKLTSIISGCD
ncbi:MAG TPA: hypothetical protein VL651_09750 [Bacteroidia bacterium]|jgi:hypothetical protein|nr:hypothetical protein [Bacteroidia bacterium]